MNIELNCVDICTTTIKMLMIEYFFFKMGKAFVRKHDYLQ